MGGTRSDVGDREAILEEKVTERAQPVERDNWNTMSKRSGCT